MGEAQELRVPEKPRLDGNGRSWWAPLVIGGVILLGGVAFAAAGFLGGKPGPTAVAALPTVPVTQPPYTPYATPYETQPPYTPYPTPYETEPPSTPPPVVDTPEPTCPPYNGGGSGLRPQGNHGRSSQKEGCLIPLPSLDQYDLSGMCLEVKREEFGSFALEFVWTMYWYGFELDALEITMTGVNNDEPVTITFTPPDGFLGDLGLNGTGPKQFVSVFGVLPDGSRVDMTELITDFLGTDTLVVKESGSQGFGSICRN
jgi:hypothetical protein